MFFKADKKPEQDRLYQILRRADFDRLRTGAPTGRGTRYVAYSRGCGGGASFLVREEDETGGCRAYAILATYEESGIEDSSFASAPDALDFVSTAIRHLCGK
jgi:hypothetical protein